MKKSVAEGEYKSYLKGSKSLSLKHSFSERAFKFVSLSSAAFLGALLITTLAFSVLTPQ